MNQFKRKLSAIAPALTLMIMAPMLAEVLPGATRFSSIFVLPIEICVWGGGALLIRYAVRRWHLGWLNMLFLAIALSIAEECLIQQTSLAPLVIHLKGVIYARMFGVNYVYFLWALVYEPVFVVFLPIYLVELIFPNRCEDLWVSKTGLFVVIPFFFIGSCLAWYSWTHIARPNVFHLPVYNLPLAAILIAGAAICGLIFTAIGPYRNMLVCYAKPLKPPTPWMLSVAGALWAVLWYGLVLLAFGIAPYFPPLIAMCAGFLLVVVILLLLPRWTVDPRWQHNHLFAVIFGTILGSMLVGFIGFLDTTGADLYFKIIINIIAVGLMVVLGLKVRKQLI